MKRNTAPSESITSEIPESIAGSILVEVGTSNRKKLDLLNEADYLTAVQIFVAVGNRNNITDGQEDAAADLIINAIVTKETVVSVGDWMHQAFLAVRRTKYRRSHLASLDALHEDDGWDTPNESVRSAWAIAYETERTACIRETLNDIPLRVRQYVIRRDSGLPSSGADQQYYYRWLQEQARQADKWQDSGVTVSDNKDTKRRDATVRWFVQKSSMSARTANEVRILAARLDWSAISTSREARTVLTEAWRNYRRERKAAAH